MSPVLPFTDPAVRRDSFTILRETMRWRVALVLSSLITVLMVVLALLNTSLGLRDTAWLAWSIMLVTGSCVVALLTLPRPVGTTVFFGAIGLVLVAVPAFGLALGRPVQYWSYVFPPLLVFLFRPGPALAGMLAYGLYVGATLVPIVPTIDVVRFGSAYGLLVCFMYTYALLENRAAAMLRYHSKHDALTNCLNRRTFNEALESLERSQRPDRECTFQCPGWNRSCVACRM
jgi:hypothetical protein